MSAKDYEAEDDLLGSILRSNICVYLDDDYEEVFSNNHTPLCN